MTKLDKLADRNTSYQGENEQFYDERLAAYYKDVWPSRIDHAALDLLFGIAIGTSNNPGDIGGMIGRSDFGNATGEYYIRGLTELAGEQSDLPDLIKQYTQKHGNATIGDLVFRLNELRYELEKHLTDDDEHHNLNRAIEALIDKIATTAISGGVTRQALQRPESVSDVVLQLFSDPEIISYADELTDIMSEVAQRESFLEHLDAPHMTTPLWEHQQEALKEWANHDCRGYVDMATATGKTVLGLAAIALLYGRLHPDDEQILSHKIESANENSRDRNSDRILVVAGQKLILEQWRSEFDEHLNIPRERTHPTENTMEFAWGTIQFRTASDLYRTETLSQYDLVILDEAHEYSKGNRTGGWNQVLEKLVEKSGAILAMSGSIDAAGQSDQPIKRALETHLHECIQFSVAQARDTGIIANFTWNIFYAPAADSVLQESLIESTEVLANVYDESNHVFTIENLELPRPDNIPDTFGTLTDLRAFSQSKTGVDARNESPSFDKLATNALSRRPKQWQLSPTTETLVELVDRHAPEQQCVVLTQSYEQAHQLGDALKSQYGHDLVLVPESGTSDQFAAIDEFKEKNQGIIVGPASVLGVGVDLPNAEVAINISKGGVNASLIQQIGRVLRNPRGDKEAIFYQVVTVPSDHRGILFSEDGHRLLRRASEFRALGARLRQLPGYDIATAEVGETLSLLERHGADVLSQDERLSETIVGDEVAQEFLQDICQLIIDTNHDSGNPQPLLSMFKGEHLDRQIRPVAAAVERTENSRNIAADHKLTMDTTEISAKNSTSSRSADTIDITVSPTLNHLLELELQTEQFASLDELIDVILGEYLGSHLNNDTTSPAVISELSVELPTYLERIVAENLADQDTVSVEDYVLNAIYEKIGIHDESVRQTVTLGKGMAIAIEQLIKNSELSPTTEDIITEALKFHFTK